MASTKRRAAGIAQELEELDAPLVAGPQKGHNRRPEPVVSEDEPDDLLDRPDEDDDELLGRRSKAVDDLLGDDDEADDLLDRPSDGELDEDEVDTGGLDLSAGDFEESTPVGDDERPFEEKTNVEALGDVEEDAQILDQDEFESVAGVVLDPGEAYESLEGDGPSTAVSGLPENEKTGPKTGAKLLDPADDEFDPLLDPSDDDDDAGEDLLDPSDDDSGEALLDSLDDDDDDGAEVALEVGSDDGLDDDGLDDGILARSDDEDEEEILPSEPAPRPAPKARSVPPAKKPPEPEDDDDDISLPDSEPPAPKKLAKRSEPTPPPKKAAKRDVDEEVLPDSEPPPPRPEPKKPQKVEAPKAKLSEPPKKLSEPPVAVRKKAEPSLAAAMAAASDAEGDDDEEEPSLEMDSGLDDDLDLPEESAPKAAAPAEKVPGDFLDLPIELTGHEEGQVAFDAQITPLKVMFGCATHKSSGSLRFKGSAGGFKLDYADGSIVEVFTSVEKLDLPAFLLDNEVCDEETIQKAKRSLENERAESLQAAMIQRNLAPAASINRATVLWAKSILGEVIRIDNGSCHFTEGKVHTPAVPLAFGPWQAPIEAVRAGFLKRDLERRLAPVMEQAASLNPACEVKLDDVAFLTPEKAIFASVDGAKTIKQLLDSVKSDQAQQMNALRALFVAIESTLLVTGSARDVGQMTKAKEILEQFEKIKDGDEYAILGVPRSANAQMIRARIQELKKIYAADPEGETQALQDAKAQLFSLFEKAVRTFSARKDELGKPRVLARPVSVMEKTRTVVAREGSALGGDAAPVVAVEDNATKAKKLFDQAEAAAKRGSYKEASEKLDKANELDPDRKTLYKVHQIYYKSVSDKTDRLAAAKAGVKEIETAMATGMQVAEGWVLIGRLYKFAREKESSAKAFEKAVVLDPNNQEAKTEVNMAQRRGLTSAEVLAAGSRGPAASAFSFLKKKIEQTSQKTGIKLPAFDKKKDDKKKDDKKRPVKKPDSKKDEEEDDDIP
ncbi:MAG: hypothetical protein HY791_39480 [Deltaproteobacteria bacterium]|nr:hypothetical protein [Deltaproteobacteria bacterium]